LFLILIKKFISPSLPSLKGGYHNGEHSPLEGSWRGDYLKFCTTQIL